MAQSNQIRASYLITTEEDPEKIATAIAFEQTVEMPEYLISDPRILEKIVGQISEIHAEGEDQYRIILEYSPDILNGSLNQFMNLVFGNISLMQGIRLIELALPPDFLQKFPGPAYGVSGLRSRTEIFGRPLTCTALKPLGCSAPELARICYELSLGGIDIIKDDHNLGNQPTCTYQDRVRLCREALLKAQEKSGRKSLYFTNINDSPGVMQQQIEYALELGVDGLLLQPVITGLDFFRSIAENQSYPFFLMAHPSLSGVFFTSSKEGIAPEILLGTLFRMAGADAVIFPDCSGRFAFDENTCRRISTNLLAPLGTILPSFPIPAGGIRLSNLPEVRGKYPEDTIFLIGAGLYGSGRNLQENVKRFLDQLLSENSRYLPNNSRLHTE
ncbi:MAG: RuBisCO large subunit C-terminal-like domain-containing protein [bacterium]